MRTYDVVVLEKLDRVQERAQADVFNIKRSLLKAYDSLVPFAVRFEQRSEECN